MLQQSSACNLGHLRVITAQGSVSVGASAYCIFAIVIYLMDAGGLASWFSSMTQIGSCGEHLSNLDVVMFSCL